MNFSERIKCEPSIVDIQSRIDNINHYDYSNVSANSSVTHGNYECYGATNVSVLSSGINAKAKATEIIAAELK